MITNGKLQVEAVLLTSKSIPMILVPVQASSFKAVTDLHVLVVSQAMSSWASD